MESLEELFNLYKILSDNESNDIYFKIREHIDSDDKRQQLINIILNYIKQGNIDGIDYYTFNNINNFNSKLSIDNFKESICECYEVITSNNENSHTKKLFKTIKKHSFYDNSLRFGKISSRGGFMIIMKFMLEFYVKYRKLEHQNLQLSNENFDLKNQINYAPDGLGYIEAKNHFNILSNKYINKTQ